MSIEMFEKEVKYLLKCLRKKLNVYWNVWERS